MSFVIKKRTALVALLAIVGIGMIFIGWQTGDMNLAEENTVPTAKLINNANNSESQLGQTQQSDKADSSEALANSSNSDSNDFFVETRLDREQARGQQIEYLREVISNAASNDQTRQRAQENLLSLSNRITKEIEVENLIRAKGFKDAAVYLEDKGVTVVIHASQLSSEEAARISDLVSRGTGVSEQNIVIIPKG